MTIKNVRLQMGVGGFKCKKSVRKKKGEGGSRVLKKVYDFI